MDENIIPISQNLEINHREWFPGLFPFHMVPKPSNIWYCIIHGDYRTVLNGHVALAVNDANLTTNHKSILILALYFSVRLLSNFRVN